MRDASLVSREDSQLLFARQHAAELARDWATANRRRARRPGPASRAGRRHRNVAGRALRAVRLAVARGAIACGRAIGGAEVA